MHRHDGRQTDRQTGNIPAQAFISFILWRVCAEIFWLSFSRQMILIQQLLTAAFSPICFSYHLVLWCAQSPQLAHHGCWKAAMSIDEHYLLVFDLLCVWWPGWKWLFSSWVDALIIYSNNWEVVECVICENSDNVPWCQNQMINLFPMMQKTGVSFRLFSWKM